jgi:hypothetical protein
MITGNALGGFRAVSYFDYAVEQSQRRDWNRAVHVTFR